jgi:hypothetical protein
MGDGVYFTKAGAVKLGHYVERELKPAILARATPAVPPAPEATPTPSDPPRVPARPLAGPVVPLTATDSTPDELCWPFLRLAGLALAGDAERSDE